MGRLSFDKLKDFFFGKPEEQTPKPNDTKADDTEEQAFVIPNREKTGGQYRRP
jgi:hypothetical protein